MFEKLQKFISYWYFRYLLVTELYMVEKWERIFIHVFFLVLFGLLALFNNSFIVKFVQYISTNESLPDNFIPAPAILGDSIKSEF